MCAASECTSTSHLHKSVRTCTRSSTFSARSFWVHMHQPPAQKKFTLFAPATAAQQRQRMRVTTRARDQNSSHTGNVAARSSEKFTPPQSFNGCPNVKVVEHFLRPAGECSSTSLLHRKSPHPQHSWRQPTMIRALDRHNKNKATKERHPWSPATLARCASRVHFAWARASRTNGGFTRVKRSSPSQTTAELCRYACSWLDARRASPHFPPAQRSHRCEAPALRGTLSRGLVQSRRVLSTTRA